MTKYMRPYQQSTQKPRRVVHPIWRGIGCVLIIMIPILSYAIASLVVEANNTQHWFQIPKEIANSLTIPGLGTVGYTELALTVIIMVIGYGILTLFYALIYRIFGPSNLGPMDAPPR
jgi:uncharacterized membrane protein YidH (DUF202 family)